ncbi:unnamed protein product [Haemonchus placei]|uniref:Kelch repeat protein n=1 Tax=Haemonchus placei TaxID=6290 RepID=A0A0N4WKY5_HAEPC|nr:unnamed protein product [Haemonchus placei]
MAISWLHAERVAPGANIASVSPRHSSDTSSVDGRDTRAIRYNPDTDQWISDVAPCPTGRYSFGVAALDDHLYVVGGFENRSGPGLDLVECYDVQRNEWTSVAPMSSCRASLSVSVLDGCLYAVGGFNESALNAVER